MEASLLGGQRRGGDGPQESVGHLGVHLQRRDPRRYVQGVLVHHRLEAVVGGHRGQRGVVGRGDGAVHGRRGAVVGQLQVHAVRGALRRHHALQHVEGRLVCLVGEARGQRALQCGDAASVRGHLPRPWWPGPPPWEGPQSPAKARCCPAWRPVTSPLSRTSGLLMFSPTP